MKGKKGAEYLLVIVTVAILLLIGLTLVIVYTLGGFAKLTGEEGIGKAQAEARAGLLGVDWDALTSKEQKNIEKKDPKIAAEIQLNTAQAAIVSKDYDGAKSLANEAKKLTQDAASKLSAEDLNNLNEKADKILAEAEAGKKILAERDSILEEQKTKVSESESKILGFETYKTRFNKLLTQESIAIKGAIGKESLVDQLIYKIVTGGFNSLLADVDKLATANAAVKEEIGYQKLRANIYLNLIKMYSVGKDPKLSQAYYAFNHDINLKIQTTYNEESVLEAVDYYAAISRYNTGQRDKIVLLALMGFYNKYHKDSKQFSQPVMDKVHEVYLMTAKVECPSRSESETTCRAINVDPAEQKISSEEARKYPKAVCYYDYNGGNDCDSCALIKDPDAYDEESMVWFDQCKQDPCGICGPGGCKVNKKWWAMYPDCELP